MATQWQRAALLAFSEAKKSIDYLLTIIIAKNEKSALVEKNYRL